MGHRFCTTLQRLWPFRIACHIQVTLWALLQHASLNLRCSALVDPLLPTLRRLQGA